MVGLAVALAATACTGHPAPATGPSSSAVSQGSAPTRTGPASVPMRTEVTHVAGRLSGADRRRVAARVARSITAYVDAAFLRGDYPRTDFTSSFGAFTPGAVTSARRDRALLTNQPLGASTRSVRATRRTANLSVLAPGGHVAGASAAVDLVFLVDRGRAASRRVHLQGRLLMTRDRSGAWAIFGYDLHRSASRAGSAS